MPADDSPTAPSVWDPRYWPQAGRWAGAIALGLVLVLLTAALTVVVMVRKPLPQTSGELDIPGLTSEVEVIRDGNGIPQIYADTTGDLMRAQGYVAAQDRFFEMDVRRHIVSGRMAEMFGEPGLETDKFIRTMGWRQVAEREWAMLGRADRDALTAYADGVNAYLDDNTPTGISLEYTLLQLSGLDVDIEQWTPVDSLGWLKAMAWDLRGNMTDEINRSMLAVDHSPSEIAELFPGYPYGENRTIVTQGRLVDGRYEPDATGSGGSRETRARAIAAPAPAPSPAPAGGADRVEAAGATPAADSGTQARPLLRGLADAVAALPPMIGSGEGVGSNSFVIGGQHTTTGKPILANDPHLAASQPGIWTQVGLHCRSVGPQCPYDVSGFGFAGVPGVVVGRNRRIAWGVTNLGPDVTDLYLERIRGTTALYDRRWRPLEIGTETIEVNGGHDVDLTVRRTRHGPLLSDVSSELSTVGANAAQRAPEGPQENYAVALKWTALKPTRTFQALLAMNRATNHTAFRDALRSFAVPAQNVVYADVDGNIAYQAPGLIPIRKSGNDGRMPAEGWLPENDWTGSYVPFDALPWVLNPPDGYLVTANQAVAGPAYPYNLGSDFDQGYRSQRINDLLRGSGSWTVDRALGVMNDTRNPIAPALVPQLLRIPLRPGYASDGQRLLRDWDYSQPADSAAAAYFNVVWRNLLELAFDDEIRADARSHNESRWYTAVRRLLDDPRNPWWDDKETPKVETRDDILRAALLEGRDEITRLISPSPKEWEWGRLHRANLRSQVLGDDPVAGFFLNRDGYRAPGGSGAVTANGWDPAVGYEVANSVSMRMVVDLSDPDSSRWINQTGASGHAASANYDDQTEMWLRGDALPWRFSEEAVRRDGEETLRLR